MQIPDDRADDEAAIRAVIADIERSFNTNDADLGAKHFTDDGWGVSVAGSVVSGRDAVLEASRTAYAGPLRDQFARYDVADVAFLRPDIAILRKEARATTPDGEPTDVGHAMVALYVLVRNDGSWQIAARQNTLVQH